MKQIPHTIKNKKAYYDYTILDSWEAGIILQGEEVKAIRTRGLDLSGSYILFRKEQPYLVGATIPRYSHSSNPQYNSKRDRSLLLKQQEIVRIHHVMQSKGVTLVPLEGYFKHNIFKMKIGAGKGKRKYDKRETIKKRETEREVREKWKNV